MKYGIRDPSPEIWDLGYGMWNSEQTGKKVEDEEPKRS